MDRQKDSGRADQRVAPRSKRRLWQSLNFVTQSGPGTFLLCALFTFVMLHNYVLPLGSLLYTTGIKGQDCGQMIWNLWFVNETITSGHTPFSTQLIFYPLGANLAHHTLAAGFFPLTFLVQKLSGNDPLYPFYAFKIIIALSLTLILWLSYLTLREIGLSRWASLIPAISYTFSDFYMLHVIHINHLAGFFIPLTALFLIRAYKHPASLNLMMAALAASCSVYFTEFSIYICMAVMFFVVAACVFKALRRELVVKLLALGSRRLITASLIFLLIVAPFTVNLFRDKIVNPPPDEPSHYSANLAGFFLPGQERDQAELYGEPFTTPLYGRAFAALDSRITVGIGGFEIFVGFPLLLFSALALVVSSFEFRVSRFGFPRPGSSPAPLRQQPVTTKPETPNSKLETRNSKLVCLCFASALLFFVLSLGPTLKVFGTETGLPMPYSVLMKIPPFDTGRTPVRFVVMGLFFLMLVAAHGVSWSESFFTVRLGRRWTAFAMLCLLAWTTAEVYSPTQRRAPFMPPDLSRIIPGSTLNLPPVQWDGYAAMLQTFHHQPIATGYLARNNAAQWAQFAAFKTAFDKGDASFCEYVSSKGFSNLIIAPDSITLPYRFSMSPLELSRCPVNVVDLRDRVPGPFGLVEPDGSELPVAFPLYGRGAQLHFGNAEVDKYLWYGWSGREIVSHWTDRGKATLIFGLSAAEQKQIVTLRIFGGPFLAPGKLDTQRVILKLNDVQIAMWNLNRAEPQEQSTQIPAGVLKDKNVLMFIVPDACSPKSLGVSEDVRLLGFNVQWIEMD